MALNSFSFLTSLIWVSIFAIIIKLLSRQMFLLRSFSIYPITFLICLSLVKIILPIELFYTQIIRSENILPVLQRVLNYPFIKFHSKSINVSLLNILILIGSVVSLYKFYKKTIEYRRFYNLLCILPASDDLRLKLALTKIKDLTGYKKEIKIIVHKSIKAPAIVGLYSPIIILPELFFTDDELLGVLLHEWQHYQQGHAIIKGCCDIIQTIFWWNPVFSHLNSEVEHTLEMHSDEKVSHYLNKQQQQCYLNAIIKVVENLEDNQKKSILTCCLVEDAKGNHLKQRFKMMLENNYSKENKQRSKLFIPVIFVLLVLSYAFVIQPYSNPNLQDYGMMTDISINDYLVKTESGYNLYNDRGKLIANILVINDDLKHLKIINEGDLP